MSAYQPLPGEKFGKKESERLAFVCGQTIRVDGGFIPWEELKADLITAEIRWRQVKRKLLEVLKKIGNDFEQWSTEFAEDIPKLREFPHIFFASLLLVVIGVIGVFFCDAYPYVSEVVKYTLDIVGWIIIGIGDAINIVLDVVRDIVSVVCSLLGSCSGSVIPRLDVASSPQDLWGALLQFFEYNCDSKYHRIFTYALLFIQRYTHNVAQSVNSNLDGNAYYAYLIEAAFFIGIILLGMAYVFRFRRPRVSARHTAVQMYVILFETVASPTKMDLSSEFGGRQLVFQTKHWLLDMGFLPPRMDRWHQTRVFGIIVVSAVAIGAVFFLHGLNLTTSIFSGFLNIFLGPSGIVIECLFICIGYLLLGLGFYLIPIWIIFTFLTFFIHMSEFLVRILQFCFLLVYAPIRFVLFPMARKCCADVCCRSCRARQAVIVLN